VACQCGNARGHQGPCRLLYSVATR
jgi:hypothetical protein